MTRKAELGAILIVGAVLLFLQARKSHAASDAAQGTKVEGAAGKGGSAPGLETFPDGSPIPDGTDPCLVPGGFYHDSEGVAHLCINGDPSPDNLGTPSAGSEGSPPPS